MYSTRTSVPVITRNFPPVNFAIVGNPSFENSAIPKHQRV